jgi:ribosomal protein L6P/L9E
MDEYMFQRTNYIVWWTQIKLYVNSRMKHYKFPRSLRRNMFAGVKLYFTKSIKMKYLKNDRPWTAEQLAGEVSAAFDNFSNIEEDTYKKFLHDIYVYVKAITKDPPKGHMIMVGNDIDDV